MGTLTSLLPRQCLGELLRAGRGLAARGACAMAGASGDGESGREQASLVSCHAPGHPGTEGICTDPGPGLWMVAENAGGEGGKSRWVWGPGERQSSHKREVGQALPWASCLGHSTQCPGCRQ